jgi:hypothetical protein
MPYFHKISKTAQKSTHPIVVVVGAGRDHKSNGLRAKARCAQHFDELSILLHGLAHIYSLFLLKMQESSKLAHSLT